MRTRNSIIAFIGFCAFASNLSFAAQPVRTIKRVVEANQVGVDMQVEHCINAPNTPFVCDIQHVVLSKNPNIKAARISKSSAKIDAFKLANPNWHYEAISILFIPGIDERFIKSNSGSTFSGYNVTAAGPVPLQVNGLGATGSSSPEQIGAPFKMVYQLNILQNFSSTSPLLDLTGVGQLNLSYEDPSTGEIMDVRLKLLFQK